LEQLICWARTTQGGNNVHNRKFLHSIELKDVVVGDAILVLEELLIHFSSQAAESKK
jgi:hypothetical protein